MLEKIVAMLGASPTQYRLLLKTEKLVEKRALEGKNDLSNMSLAGTLCFRFYNQCFIHIYAVHLIDGHIYFFAYRHHDVYGDDKPLDSPIF